MSQLDDIRKLNTITAPDVADGDLHPVFDISTGEWKSITHAQQEAADVNQPKAIVLTGDFRAAFVVSPYVKLLDMAKSPLLYPYGITITSWSCDCANNATPTNQIAALIRYCVSPTTGTVPGASVVTVDTIATTAGNQARTSMAASTAGTGNVPAAKLLYLEMTLNPTDIDTIWTLTINFTPNLS